MAGIDSHWIIKREQVKRNVEGMSVDELAKERYDLAVEQDPRDPGGKDGG